MALDNPTPIPSSVPAQRLGKNQGRYLGETIEIQSVLNQIQTLALKHGWRSDCFLNSEQIRLLAYHRECREPRKRLYLSAGIHGDEPAGPMAVHELMRKNRWPDHLDILLCPCLNPTGFPLNSRENSRGLDLNRQSRSPLAEETQAHMTWLLQQPPFDASLCLHEDWESQGFYVYELSLEPGRSFAEEIVRRVAAVCPIDNSALIESWEAHGGIIRPTAVPASRPDWPEAFFLIHHKTRLSCTLEAPSDFPLQTRVAALVAGVEAVLDQMAAEIQGGRQVTPAG